jgi:hypothetical protein
MAPTKSPKLRLLHIRDEIDGLTTLSPMWIFKPIAITILCAEQPNARCKISEPAKTLPASLRDQAPEIPWTAIISIGNVLRHDYQHIDDHRLWNVATVHLPELRPAVMRLLAELEE